MTEQTEFECPETGTRYEAEAEIAANETDADGVVEIVLRPQEACPWCHGFHHRRMLAPAESR